MLVQIEVIANNIRAKLQALRHPLTNIDLQLNNLRESNNNPIVIKKCLHFLLKISCGFNLLEETHKLLELNLFGNIDQPLELNKESVPLGNTRNKSMENTYSLHMFSATNSSDHLASSTIKTIRNPRTGDRSLINKIKIIDMDEGKTLLGLAAFHGHYEIVCYLVEVRLANVNAQDIKGDTPLHQVVYGDSHPFNHMGSLGASHDQVAEYLLDEGADLSITNKLAKTPYDNTKWCAPLKIENLVGRRFITNTGSAAYYADKVRPIFEKYLAKHSQHEGVTIVRSSASSQMKNFNQFCLEHAIADYVRKGQGTFNYADIRELSQKLSNLSEVEWEHFRYVIASQEPAPHSFKYGPISEHLPLISKQCALLGLMTTLLTLYLTQNISLSVIAGTISGAMAWSYLTDNVYKQFLTIKSSQHARVSALQKHDRFFKDPYNKDQAIDQQYSKLGLRQPSQGLKDRIEEVFPSEVNHTL